MALFRGLRVSRVDIRAAIWLARHTEHIWPRWFHGGAFQLVVVDLSDLP